MSHFKHPTCLLRAPPYSNNSTPLCSVCLDLFYYYAVCTRMFTSLAPPVLWCIYLCLLIAPLPFMFHTPYVISPHLLIAPHFSQFTPLLLGSLYFQLLLTAPPPFNKHTSFTSCTSHIIHAPSHFVFQLLSFFILNSTFIIF